MKQKNILIICHSYASFQKDSIEELSKFFSNVYVLVRYNPISEIARYLPIQSLQPFRKDKKIDLSDKPENVHVFLTPVYYAPIDSQYKILGKKHLSAVEKIINNHHLQFEIIHAHFTWSAGYVGAKLKEHYSVPLVVTAHGYDIYSFPFKDPIWKNNIKYVLETADTIITVSQNNLDCIRELDVDTPVHVIQNGFRSDLFYHRDTFDCRKTLEIPLNRKIILTVGNLETIKGQRYLVEAVKEITQTRKDILCVIIGLGRLHNALKHQIRSLGLNDFVILAGGKPHNEIPLWMNACDIFVLPSLNEGNPTVMFEAIGCGKPFVGTKVGGISDVISSEVCGLLVDPADPKDLVKKILSALDRKWDREKILAYAERFTWENIVKDIIHVYMQVLK